MQSSIKQSWATEKAMHLSVQPTLNKPQSPLFFVLHRYPPLEAILFKILLDTKYAHLSPNPKRWKKKKKDWHAKIYLSQLSQHTAFLLFSSSTTTTTNTIQYTSNHFMPEHR